VDSARKERGGGGPVFFWGHLYAREGGIRIQSFCGEGASGEWGGRDSPICSPSLTQKRQRKALDENYRKERRPGLVPEARTKEKLLVTNSSKKGSSLEEKGKRCSTRRSKGGKWGFMRSRPKGLEQFRRDGPARTAR